MPIDQTRLSVVIGSQNARLSIRECLSELETQRPIADIEIIVADNSTDGTAEIVRAEFPNVILLKCPSSYFVPQLWEDGINKSRGEIVALLTANCIPWRDWVTSILTAHKDPSPGIGGAIENDGSGGLIGWAVYFCRYSPFMLPFSERIVRDIPGDNASYKRWALDRCKQVRRNGFWEPVIHSELRKDGYQVLLKPTIVVYQRLISTFRIFLRQRFWHGRQFGSTRASYLPRGKRIVYILFSPMIPGIFLIRITRRLLMKKRHFTQFFLSLPILIMFLLSWSLGELSGYLWKSDTGAVNT